MNKLSPTNATSEKVAPGSKAYDTASAMLSR